MKPKSKSKQAVFWIMSAPPGTKRTQAEAAAKFGLSQPVVSLAMKRWVADNIKPDGRRTCTVKRTGKTHRRTG